MTATFRSPRRLAAKEVGLSEKRAVQQWCRHVSFHDDEDREGGRGDPEDPQTLSDVHP
jgi:hypothetical protein